MYPGRGDLGAVRSHRIAAEHINSFGDGGSRCGQPTGRARDGSLFDPCDIFIAQHENTGMNIGMSAPGSYSSETDEVLRIIYRHRGDGIVCHWYGQYRQVHSAQNVGVIIGLHRSREQQARRNQSDYYCCALMPSVHGAILSEKIIQSDRDEVIVTQEVVQVQRIIAVEYPCIQA